MLVYIAVLMPVLLLFCGLVVDVGQMEISRLQAQSASDAAALGGALEVERAASRYVAAGKGDASLNGFTDGSNGTTVTVQLVPTYGDYQGFYDAVQATVTHQVGLTFLSAAGISTGTVSAQSTALIAPCAYVLNGFNHAQTVFTGTSATVNSTCPWYIYGSGTIDSASTFNSLATNITGTAAATTWNASGGPPPRYNVAPITDPLAGLTQPAFSSCQTNGESVPANTTRTLSPGVYCGGITIASGSTVTLSPGLYIITGGMSVQGSTVTGTGGVTLFFTTGGGSSYGTVSFTNSTLNLIAPVSSSNPGIPGISLDERS